MTASPVRVLLVDDEERIRNSLSRLISHRLCPERGVVIETAGDVRSALDKLEASSFDLVLTDFRMPERTGAELLAIIGARWPRTCRVLMSGYGDLDERVGPGQPMAAQVVVSKPWQSGPLVAALSELLER